jgi:hypothetical protein
MAPPTSRAPVSSSPTNGLTIREESEIAQAKIKAIDEPGKPRPAPVRKDVNTFINNQLKFSDPHPPTTIPPSQMKCNILKAQTELGKNGKRKTLYLSSR